jgi:Transglutaminase-like superfamily
MSRPVVAGSPYHELIKPIGRRAKVRLVVEILRDYVRVRRFLRRRDLPTVVAALRADAGLETDRVRQAQGLRLGHAVERTLGWVPFDSRCLVRSLVLTSMLSRRGISSRLVIGVDNGDRFSAHAWVESGDRPMLEPLDQSSRLVEL